MGSHLKQFSVRHGKMIIDYGRNFGFESIITTPDNKWLFASCREGYLMQICLKSQQVVHDYGQIHDQDLEPFIGGVYSSIRCFETTRDSKWLFTGGIDGHVKRISVENRAVDQDFWKVCEHWVLSMKITPDNEKLLVGGNLGELKLISSKDGDLIKDFGYYPDGWITGIVIAVDLMSFFRCSDKGALKQTYHSGLPLSISANKKISSHGDKNMVRLQWGQDKRGFTSMC
jgi:WD40 repeat protein